ncbi:MAG: RluA family pseudouridine synthase [Chloroflexota bacterium]
MSDRQINLTLDAAGERLDKALGEALPAYSRMQWQKLIKKGSVQLNGVVVSKPSLRLSGGEEITAVLPELIDVDLVPENIPLDIRYEDNDILLINKPSGMVVHPGTGHERGTLVNAVLGYCPEVLGVGGEVRPGIVHRLDKETSGLILVAKNDHALHYLQQQFHERQVKKVYLALVEGHIRPSKARVDAPLGRDPKHRKRQAVITSEKYESRPAQTDYYTKRLFKEATLVECHPYTGRTHQIRVHLAYVGFPIVGDKYYGRRKPKILLERHFLHAAQLTFKRPFDHKSLTFSTELPADLQTLLQTLTPNDYQLSDF